MAEFLFRVGRWSARRAWTVIAAWAVLLAAAAAAFTLFGGTLSNAFSIPGTATEEVTEHLQEELPQASGGSGSIVLSTEDGEPFTEEQRAEISALAAEAGEADGVAAVVDPFAAEAERAERAQAIEAGAAEIEAAREELEAAQAQIDAAREQGGSSSELDAQEAEVQAGLAEAEAQAAALEQGAAMLELAEGITTVSEDGSAAIVNVAFTEPQMEVTPETKAGVTDVFDEAPLEGVAVDYSSEMSDPLPSLFGVSEVVGLIVAGVVLIVMLGTLIGAGLPLLTALVGVGVGALATMSLSSVVDMASVTPILGLMLGLAVGIDYSLFILNRHRRQLKEGYDLDESIALANGTSGNAVVFAGTTVLIALVALNVTGIPFLGLMGSVGAFCVAVAVLVAVTFMPALLSLVGMKVLGRKERAAREANGGGGDEKPLKAMSTPRAALRALVAVGALVLVALPAMDMRLNLPDGSSEPHDTTQYQAYATIAERFGEGANGPLLVVADLPGSPGEAEAQAAQAAVAQAIAAEDDVEAVAPVGLSEDRTVAAFQVVPAEGPTSESTEELVHTLRGLDVEGVEDIGVAGSASGNIDISEKLADALPVYLAVVVGLSLLILILVFRSILVPVIATLGFILSYFAALGGVVAIYQWGWLADVFGVDTPGPILNFLPTIVVGVLFGLAMDYMLFLGSGMREAYAHGVPARPAVVHGLRAGRAVVTAAAIIMISVFGGFVFSHSAMIRPIGFALAFGVLVDAFLVRMLIIPALMHLFGDKVWWLPKWLDRILPDVDVEGAALERRHPHRDADKVEVSV
ncbi:MMPL family transporter [Glycomyces tenuis]|uniref:MMPL family transporter n=1 Tax=Glycomyces tenuis TaxID=58116 RepID=UPI0004148A26|nr:MMPL family transporter [Glycomyces tenuis]